MENSISYRNELKYICTVPELKILESRLNIFCKKDPHARVNGTYDIRSIYFDDINNTCFKENESGTDPRSKYRIRIYNGDCSRISLEKKSKSHGMTSKKSQIITIEQFNNIMSGHSRNLFEIRNNASIPAKDNSLLYELETLIYTRGLSPKVIVTYERTPYIYNAGNVRVTFDRKIGYSTNLSSFFDENIYVTPVLTNGTHILEVKYDELLPTFLYEVLNLNNLIHTNFSKYYLSRRRQ